MIIIGVGSGPGMLTEETIRAIKVATAIHGSDRAIEIAQPFIAPGRDVGTIDDFKALHRLPDDVVVLSTGDPMLAGLGYLAGTVIPGIASLKVAAARLHISLARTSVVVAHWGDMSRVCQRYLKRSGGEKLSISLWTRNSTRVNCTSV
ncbi:MAG: SAM-dependent methyltransferase [Methanomicrobiales archaeon]